MAMDYFNPRVIDGTGMILDTTPGSPDTGSYVTETQLKNWIKAGILFDGYYYNGNFYSDSGHTSPLAKVEGALYVDKTNSNKALYVCLSSTYQSLTEEAQVQAIIDGLNDGTIVPLKAKQDQNGNVIDTTYETKADANDLKNALQATNKRVTNLEQKAGDEIVVDYPSSTYGMDEVPANVAEYGKVTKLRGVSRARNQKILNYNFSDGTAYYTLEANVSLTASGGIGTVTSTVAYYGIYMNNSNAIAGHTYLISIDAKTNVAGANIRWYFGGSGNAYQFSNISSTMTRYQQVVTPTSVSGACNICMSEAGSFDITNINCKDLTLYFGSTVPTLAEIQTNYPELLIPSDYDAGSLVSTTYSGIKSYKTDSTELDTLLLSSPVELRSAGSVHDELDVESGKKTNPLYNYTFTGSESWVQWNAKCYFANAITKACKDGYSTVNCNASFALPTTADDLYYNGDTIGRAIACRSFAIYVSVDMYNNRSELVGKTVTYALGTPDPDEQLTPVLDPFLKVEGGGTISPIQTQTTEIDSAMTAEYLSLGA